MWRSGDKLQQALRNTVALNGTRLLIAAPLGGRGATADFHHAGFAGWVAKPVRAVQVQAALAKASSVRNSPVHSHKHDLDKDDTNCPKPSAAKPAGDSATAKPRLLIVDDNPVNQKLAERFLLTDGYAVDVAANGQEAVQLATAQWNTGSQYGAVLMDCQMPIMDGFTATEAIRALDASVGHHTPIIAMTANVGPEERSRCLRAGMDEYLAKPFNPKELRSLVRQVVAQGE